MKESIVNGAMEEQGAKIGEDDARMDNVDEQGELDGIVKSTLVVLGMTVVNCWMVG